jgi:hypothetical protein
VRISGRQVVLITGKWWLVEINWRPFARDQRNNGRACACAGEEWA